MPLFCESHLSLNCKIKFTDSVLRIHRAILFFPEIDSSFELVVVVILKIP